jgi:hypothetical protein
MLLITTETARFERTLRLEGRLAGPWIDELARTWGEVHAVRGAGLIRVDLDGVTYVSPSGKSFLRRIHREYTAEDALAQGDESLVADLIATYKALGGGWELPYDAGAHRS